MYYGQWHWENTGQYGGKLDADIDADSAWLVGEPPSGPTVGVTVVDGGFWLDRGDLESPAAIGRRDVAGPVWYSPAPDDDPNPKCHSAWTRCWHGTAVPGGLAAATGNTLGIAGLVPNVDLAVIKFVDDNGTTSSSLIAQALWEAGNFPGVASEIIVCSWQCNEDPLIDLALQGLRGDGHIVICAAGNSGGIQFPARSQYAIAIGATNDSDYVQVIGMGGLGWSSSIGQELDFVAPGTHILTLDLMGNAGVVPALDLCAYNYDYNCLFDGTSAAAPVAAGVAALVLHRRYDLWYKADPFQQIYDILVGSSEDQIGNEDDLPGWDDTYGHGRVNAYRALLSVIRGDVSNDGQIDASDIGILAGMIFFGGSAVLDDRTGDWNCDGFVDSLDLSLLIDYAWFGGPISDPCFDY